MIIRDASLTVCQDDRPKGNHCVSYSFTVNAYHVTVRQYAQEQPCFVRTPNMAEWLDAKHEAITKALAALENAIAEAANAAKPI